MKHIALRTHEVQNILAGRQTRLSRPVKLKISYEANREGRTDLDAYGVLDKNGNLIEIEESVPATLKDGFCPFGKVGDIIAAKETWQEESIPAPPEGDYDMTVYRYKASEEFDPVSRWRSPVTMPLSACRLFLRVKEIRCERIQDISQDDIVAEGIESMQGFMSEMCIWRDSVAGIHRTRKTFFKDRHNSIYGPESWDLNLWHWIIIFEKADKP